MKIFFTTLSLFLFTKIANSQTDCNSWVNLQSRFSAITVGDLDVTGNNVTVEAIFNMTGSSVNIVSKHKGGNDLNYLLRPTRGEISTDISGFVVTDQGNSPCNDVLELNKTYHAALVYDGSTLKFYRNGVLISSVPVTGNLITNNWNTAIGEHAPVVTPFVNGLPNPEYHDQNVGEGYYDESFRGFINEVRIWNVARSQAELRSYMAVPLPNPTTQPGLLGYWVLNDLQNKQGNASYNGSIEGQAEIGQTNTSCTFIADSCNIALPVRLTDFNTSVSENKEIKLTWHVEGESGIRSYSIQRSGSADFSYFSSLGIVNASDGGSNTNSYSFLDETSVRNKPYFYRLQINELSGATFYSAIKSGKVLGIFAADFYPNPTEEGLVTVRLNNISGNTSLIVLNSMGQILIKKNINALQGTIITIDLKKFEKGNYFINLITPDSKIVKKILKL